MVLGFSPWADFGRRENARFSAEPRSRMRVGGSTHMRAHALFPTILGVSGAPALFRAVLGVSGAPALFRPVSGCFRARPRCFGLFRVVPDCSRAGTTQNEPDKS